MCLKIQFCIQRLFVLFCSSSKSLHSNTHVIIMSFYANIFIDPVGIVPSNLWQIAWQLDYSLFIYLYVKKYSIEQQNFDHQQEYYLCGSSSQYLSKHFIVKQDKIFVRIFLAYVPRVWDDFLLLTVGCNDSAILFDVVFIYSYYIRYFLTRENSWHNAAVCNEGSILGHLTLELAETLPCADTGSRVT